MGSLMSGGVEFRGMRKSFSAGMRTALVACALAAPAVLGSGSAALAQSPACQGDFEKVMGPRMALIQRINGFRNRRPTAAQACQTLRSLRAADLRLIKWMSDNKDWCQIPDETIAQAQAGTQNTVRAQNQACGAASQQARQLRQLQEQQAGGGGVPRAPAVGSGVRLPQGAL
jgi:hypothetical protein